MKKLEYERAPSPLVLQDQRIQDVAAADASPSDKAEMPAVIQHIVEVVLHHQPATPQALHGIPLSERLHLVTPLRREYANRMPGHRPEDQVDFLSFAENADADEGKNLRKWGKGDTPGYGGGRNAFLTSPKNSWYGEDMTPARKAAMAREWIIFALSFGLGGHIALGLVLHNPSPARWQEMGWNIFFIGLFVYIAVQAGRSIYMAIRSHGAERDP